MGSAKEVQHPSPGTAAAIPAAAASDVDGLQKALREQGVCLVKGAFSAEQMRRFACEYHGLLDACKRSIPRMDWETRRYEFYGPSSQFDKELYENIQFGSLDGKDEVVWMGPGRFDFARRAASFFASIGGAHENARGAPRLFSRPSGVHKRRIPRAHRRGSA